MRGPLGISVPERCPECDDVLAFTGEWWCHVHPHGRLRSHEMTADFVLGCEACSATILTISGDKVAILMTEAGVS